ncbi:hypothetical protein V5G94_25010, partial [Citrobacter braakii]
IHLTMAGNEVFKVAVTELAHIVDETLEANNLDRSALDWLVPHLEMRVWMMWWQPQSDQFVLCRCPPFQLHGLRRQSPSSQL